MDLCSRLFETFDQHNILCKMLAQCARYFVLNIWGYCHCCVRL